MQNKSKYTAFIKAEAQRLGFMSCGISKAGFLEEEAPRLERWLKDERQGSMGYMADYFDKRLDPTLLVEDSKSVVSLLLNYYPEQTQNPDSYKISKYAYGKDYHSVIKKKTKKLLRSIRNEIGDVSGRAFVDFAPVMEKAWAAKSGLGWMGKNANLITQRVGSFYFIAELIIDLELEYDHITTDHCGTCTACIDACPTQAIVAPYIVDGSKCISYYTIELKEALPQEMKGKFDDWAFGCDVCQDVCPWNSFSKPHQEPLFQSYPELLSFSRKDWDEITADTFDKVFTNSPLKRVKLEGLKRNINFLK
ncbi:tRNA epoxyqueuosine(34) reductase QueG [Flavobacterium sp. SUN046]|uniref:tRNA epoxyqueuosine(34) reductase QueG n=1 Tax=Flavobacterium sp. SUN046 TaxID=3002440 RepID=UPI002DB85A7E|nr:tRNA epoxyqueuosine(34) reductase QueG [Flavobacterium sp. SUN046]MEC4050257.1 tRNA epoxyqueuosine(34) reductase QueG [Flavobacterium sp. SUN046]